LLPCGNINPLGITGTPVIDPSSQAIYFDAAVEQANGPRHEVFGLSLKDGAILPGWPIDVFDALQKLGRHFDPRTQNQRAAVSLLDGIIYVAFGGHFGDCGGYHGWVVGFSLHDPGKVVSFETRARGGGIWAPGGLSVVAHDIFLATGNTFSLLPAIPSALAPGAMAKQFFALGPTCSAATISGTTLRQWIGKCSTLTMRISEAATPFRSMCRARVATSA
jgi:hypothetical protein